MSSEQQNRLYSEGGSYSTKQENDKSSTAGIAEELEMEQEYEQPNLYTESFQEERQRQRLANIVDQLRQQNIYNQQFNAAPLFEENEDKPFLNPEEPRLRNRNAEELEELRRLASGEFILGQKEHKLIWLNKLGRALDYFEKNILAVKKLNEFLKPKKPSKMSTPVKKGQNEFVEFAEPINNQNLNSKRIKDIEWMEKRLPSDSSYFDNQRRGGGGPFHFFNASGNILFIAYLTICCVGVVAGVVGGVYYYNHVRSSNVDDPFNEFTRYSPSGPGKDKFNKRGGGGAFGQTVGDDTLAYKAQLQQYQQQKQKILGAGQTISNDQMSDNEEENDELEHNFSVFECPGLAPTGDVEIQNPNFVGENGENNTATKNIENTKKEERND
uniref:Transmembrane protein n=1 Tax=Meloidogyne javanica TaxID=6303 RepID=A0A915MME6_MELJA